MDTSYAHRTMVQKLGLKPGMRMLTINAPTYYGELLHDKPRDVIITTAMDGTFDCIHLFASDEATLAQQFPLAKEHLAINGSLWVSWPKASSKVKTDLNEHVVRQIGLANGLVDVKVMAVDQTLTGFKFVYRLKDRK